MRQVTRRGGAVALVTVLAASWAGPAGAQIDPFDPRLTPITAPFPGSSPPGGMNLQIVTSGTPTIFGPPQNVQGTVLDDNGVSVAVFNFAGDIDIHDQFTVTGTRPLVLLSRGNITI